MYRVVGWSIGGGYLSILPPIVHMLLMCKTE
jgi:hypothetical protein